MEFSVHRPSPPNTYSYVGEESLGSTRKFVKNFLLFTCVTACTTHSEHERWAEGSFLRQRKKIPPAHAQRLIFQTKASPCSLPKLFSLFFPLYVGFVPVSNLLAIFVDASFCPRFGSWPRKKSFGWRVLVGPWSTKTFHVLVMCACCNSICCIFFLLFLARFSFQSSFFSKSRLCTWPLLVIL